MRDDAAAGLGRHYAIYDVFAATPLAGNPLAVVFDADGLSEAAMQAVAREFNLSETVFVLSPDNPAHAARLRIFTPVHEMPFAGHPTVGAAVAIAQRRNGNGSHDPGAAGYDIDMVLMLEEAIGDVRCAVKLANGRNGGRGVAKAPRAWAAGADAVVATGAQNPPGFAEFDLPRLSAPVACMVKRDEVADALGVSPRQIGFENHAISVWSAGVPYVLVPLHDRAAVEQCRCDAGRWEALAPVHQGQLADPFVYCRGGIDHAAAFHARMFAPGSGIVEDPATGSAVAALSGAVMRFDAMLDGHHALMIEQGVTMGRPSKIHLHVDIKGGAIVRARIGGEAVRVAEGVLRI